MFTNNYVFKINIQKLVITTTIVITTGIYTRSIDNFPKQIVNSHSQYRR